MTCVEQAKHFFLNCVASPVIYKNDKASVKMVFHAKGHTDQTTVYGNEDQTQEPGLARGRFAGLCAQLCAPPAVLLN